MDGESLLDLLQQQLLAAQKQLEAQLSRSERTEGTAAILRILRLSLRAFSAGIDPDDEAATSFVLYVSDGGQILLRRDNHLVQISGPFFDSLLRMAGFALVPGQVLLVEPEFAKRAIEESLGEAAAEGFRLEKNRADLKTALRQSSGAMRDHLLRGLVALDERETHLQTAKVEPSELKP